MEDQLPPPFRIDETDAYELGFSSLSAILNTIERQDNSSPTYTLKSEEASQLPKSESEVQKSAAIVPQEPDHQHYKYLNRCLNEDELPTDVRKKFLTVPEKGHFYYRDRENKLAFLDKGGHMMTKDNDPHVIKSMIEVCQAKGWQSINLKGTPEFLKEAWLQASLNGLKVKGYSPTLEDQAKYDELLKSKMGNQILPDLSQAMAPKIPQAQHEAIKVPLHTPTPPPIEPPPMTIQGVALAEECRKHGWGESQLKRVVALTNELAATFKNAGLKLANPRVFDASAPVVGKTPQTGVVVSDQPLPAPEPKLNQRR